MFPRSLLLLISLLLGLHVIAQPDNDQFARRITIEGSDVVLSTFLLDATLEPGEPAPADLESRYQGSAWWSWRAPADGWAELQPDGGAALVAAFTGDRVNSLVPVFNPSPSPYGLFRVSGGTIYQLSAGFLAESGADRFPVNLHLTFRPLAGNQGFANRIPLTGDQVHLAGPLLGATEGIWWEWTPTASGFASINAAQFPGPLRVFRGTRGDSLELVADIDRFSSVQGWFVTKGEPVQLSVIWFGGLSSVDVDLRIRISPVVITDPKMDARIYRTDSLTVRLDGLPEDVESLVIQASQFQEWRFNGRPSEVVLSNIVQGPAQLVALATTTSGFVLPSKPVSIIVLSGSDMMAEAPEVPTGSLGLGGFLPDTTLEAGEPPLPSPAVFGGTLWWKWTAPSNGWLFLGPRGGDGAQVFLGQPNSTSQPLPAISSEKPLGALERFEVQAGQTYWLRLWLRLDNLNWLSTAFGFLPFARNDLPEQANPLSGSTVEVPLPRELSFCDAGDSGGCFENDGTRWYSWTAPRKGLLKVEAFPKHGPLAVLTVFKETGPNTWTPVTTEYGVESGIMVDAGVTYRVRLRTQNELSQPVPEFLRLRFAATPTNDLVSDRLPLPGSKGMVNGTNDGAVPEANGEPITRTTWWSWVPPADGVFQVKAEWPSTDPSARIRFWSIGSNKLPQFYPDQQNGWDGSWVSVTAGKEVAVEISDRVDSDPVHPTRYQLIYEFIPRPPNDTFEGRSLLVGRRIETRGTNWSAAAVAPTDPTILGSRLTRTLWWEWTAPEDGWVTIQSDAPQLVLFAGSEIGALTRVANRESQEGLSGALHAQVNRGVIYSLMAGDPPGADRLPFSPNRDGFGVRLLLTRLAIDSLVSGQKLPADTRLPIRLQPDPAGLNPVFASVTYFAAWDPGIGLASNELATISAPPTFPAEIQSPPGIRILQVRATNAAGEVFWSPPYRVQFTPLNDDFVRAEWVAGRSWSLTPVFRGATREPREPAPIHSGPGTSWYRWIAPASGIVTVNATLATLDVYTGDEIGLLQPVVSQRTATRIRFTAQAGETYSIRATESRSDLADHLSGSLNLVLASTRLVSPTPNAAFPAGSPILLLAETSESSGVVKSVEFRVGGKTVAVVTEPPYSHLWTPTEFGDFDLECIPIHADGEIVGATQVPFRVAPPNDSFANRQPLDVLPPFLEGTTAGAAADLVRGDRFNDVWYSWTAPNRGLLGAKASPEVEVEVYTGQELDFLSWNSYRENPGSGKRTWDVEAGQEYHLRVRSMGSYDSPFKIEVLFAPVAENDAFGDRAVLVGPRGSVEMSLVRATRENGEPAFGDLNGAVSTVWWTWTPTEDGFLGLEIPLLSRVNDRVAGFTGNTLATLAPLNDVYGNFNTRRPLYRVAANQPVHIRVSSTDDRDFGRDLTWEFRPLPPNDAFAQRTAVSGIDVLLTASTLGATVEADEPNGVSSLGSVWWNWTPGVDGDAYLEQQLPAIVSHFLVFLGDQLPSLVLVGSNNGMFPVQAGKSYAVQALTDNPGGFIRATLKVMLVPTHDDFATRRPLSGVLVQLTDANWRSTREYREPMHGQEWGGRSVWYRWTAPFDGPTSLSLGSASPMVLGVYQGNTLETLQEVARASSQSNAGSGTTFEARAGSEYSIAVDGLYGAQGTFELSLRQVPTESPRATLEQIPDGRFRLSLTGLSVGEWVIEFSDLIGPWTVLEQFRTEATALERILEPTDPQQMIRARKISP